MIAWLASVLVLLFFALLLALFSMKNIRITKKYIIIAVVVALAAAYWGYALQPGRDLDLYRIQAYAQGLNVRNENIFEILLNKNGKFQWLITFNLLCAVANYFDNYSLIPFVATFVVVFITLYIIFDYHASSKKTSKFVIWELLLVFTGLPLLSVFSGIRNAMAVAFVSMAVYRFLYQQKGWKTNTLLVLMAATMHPAALFPLPALILAKFKGQWLFRMMALCMLPIVFAVGPIIAKSSFAYLAYIGQKLQFYSLYAYEHGRNEMFANMAIFILIFILYQTNRPNPKYISKQWQIYINAYCILGFALLGCIVHRDFAMRLGYFTSAAGAPVLINAMTRKNANSTVQTQALSAVCLIGVGFCIFVAAYYTVVGLTVQSYIY